MRTVYELQDYLGRDITRTVLGARNPNYTDTDAIEMEVHFEEFGDEWVMFSAVENDDTQYGRDLYAAAKRGDFGEIAPYAPPSDIHDLDQVKDRIRSERDHLLQQTDWVETPSYWNRLSIEKQTEWLTYKQDLRDLPNNVSEDAYISFENDAFYPELRGVTWPTKPE